jgi:hypothetical protein
MPGALACLDSGKWTALNSLRVRDPVHNAPFKLKVGAERPRNLSTSAGQHKDGPKEETSDLGVKHCLACTAQRKQNDHYIF